MATAKMTRSQFQFIADVINDMPDYAPTLRAQKVSVAAKFARELKRTNPRFKDGTFLEACGMAWDEVIMTCKGHTSKDY
jgi:hypothetical protein